MIEKLSQFVTRRRWWIVTVWVALAAALMAFAPALSSIQSNDQSGFLPDSYESVKAQQIAEQLSADADAATDIIVFQNRTGTALGDVELREISTAVQNLNAAQLPHVTSVTTSERQVSPDRTTQLATVTYAGEAGDSELLDSVAGIRSALDDQTKGSLLIGGLTGSVAISHDTQESTERAIKIVGIGTILLVFVLPALIFRSIVAGILPVLAVGVVYLISNGLIALAGKLFDFTLSQQLSVLFDVVLFGIGTDYILFLLFRYRERLRSGDHSRSAVSYALSRAGEAILSAALVVIASFTALFFADFEMFASLAPALVICVAVMMVASLTLVPALVAIIGPKVFWPSKGWMKSQNDSGVARRVGRVVARRPGVVTAVLVLAFAGLGLGALHYKADFSSFSQPPKDTPSAEAYDRLVKAFPAGVLTPTPIYVTSQAPLTAESLQPLQTKLMQTEGVATILPATITPDQKTAVVSLILSKDPFGSEAIDDISGPIRTAAHSFNSDSQQLYVGGATSAIADVEAVTNRDLGVIFPIAAVFIFIILAVLLRSLVAPFILLLCVSLGFVATLGATTYLFQDIGNNPGLISFIPLFMYIFVVAIGTDYNILTVTRLREEIREGNDARRAADLTIEHSSATVISAGFILAATFGSLILGGIGFLSQMGTSIALGVALSSFILAPILIPALSILCHKIIWWPGHKPGQDTTAAKR